MYGQPRQSLYPGGPGAMAMAASTAASSNPSGAASAGSAFGPNVPISTQILQLDQEITSTLQEIDQNFTTCHQIVTSRILPALNRYGVASARTWQGAKFWKQFFEVSADVALTARADEHGDAYDDDDDGSKVGRGDASYEQSTTHDGDSEAHTTFNSDDITASPRSDAGAELYHQSPDRSTPRRGAAAPVETLGGAADDSGEANTFYSTGGLPRASSPPRFSNASMAAAARREAHKKKLQQQQQGRQDPRGDTSIHAADPTESPFERLRRDLTQDLGRPDDSANDSVLQSHQRQRDLASNRRQGATDKVYYDDVTNDETIEMDRSALAREVEDLDILHRDPDEADLTDTSPIAPPPRLSKHIASSSSPSRNAKKPPASAATSRARGPLLHKVLNQEQRKRDATASGAGGVGGGRKPRSSLTRFEVTPRGSSSTQNPFAQPASVKMWNGIVDLRKTPLNARVQKGGAGKGADKGKASVPDSNRRGKANKGEGDTASEWDSGEDADSFGWPAGMSPPVTMQFSVPQSKYAKTPAKEAARLMVEDLLKSVGASRSTGQANLRSAAAAMRVDNDDVGTPSQAGTERRKGVLVPGSVSSVHSRASGSSARPAGPVGTPLSRTKKEAKAVSRAAAAAGFHRRRDSMPTPPTLTKKGPPLSAGGGGATTTSRPRMSTTPEVTPQAGSFAANSSASLLRRGPSGADLEGSVTSSAAAMLMDEDEGLTAGRRHGRSSSDDEDEKVPQNLGTKLSAVALGGGPIHALPEEEDDEDSDEDSSLDSEDDLEEEEEDMQPPPSAASSRYSVLSQACDQSTSTGWTSSSVSSNSRVGGGGGRSIEDDTLFGVPKPQSQRTTEEGLRNPFSNLGAGAAGVSARAGEREPGRTIGGTTQDEADFVVWGQVDEMGTIHGGRPLIDRDDTYSAPSPTPMHFGQSARR